MTTDDYERLRDALVDTGILIWDESLRVYKTAPGFIHIRQVQDLVIKLNSIETERKKR